MPSGPNFGVRRATHSFCPTCGSAGNGASVRNANCPVRLLVLGALSATTGRANLDRSLESIRKSIPSEWHEFLIPELQTVADEVCRDEHGQPAIALDRVRELFAAKAVRTIRAAALSDRRAVLNAVVSSVGEGSAGEGCSL